MSKINELYTQTISMVFITSTLVLNSRDRQGKLWLPQNTLNINNHTICDRLSKNPPSSHLPVFREIPFKNSIKKTSLALVINLLSSKS